MSDLISRGKLFNLLAPVQTLGEAYGIIQGMETVDAVPVVHGRWIVKKLRDTDENKYAVCDQCGQVEGWYDDIGMACATLGERYAHFCPSCGARNDGEAHD